MRVRVLALIAPLLLTAACGNGGPTGPTPRLSPEPPTGLPSAAPPGAAPPAADRLAPAEAGPPSLVAPGTFLPYHPGSTAVTYDPAVVPPGARVRVVVTNTTYG